MKNLYIKHKIIELTNNNYFKLKIKLYLFLATTLCKVLYNFKFSVEEIDCQNPVVVVHHGTRWHSDTQRTLVT